MNLKLVFRIFAGFGVLFAVVGLLSPEAMMDSFGMEYNEAVGLMFTFTAMIQLMFAFVVWKLHDWAGDNLAKVGSTFVFLSLVPVALNVYHVAKGTLPATGAFYGEQVVWLIFAGLFYTYSKK